MLRNVLDDWLGKISERELDVPLLLLLSAMGFYDVHLVHGPVEFGRDFIGKKRLGEELLQFSFQSKKGNLSQQDLRNEVFGQLREAVEVPTVHPNFDRIVPHQVVLVTTGDIIGNARLT
ncbi:MAG: hypothetical protein AB7G88_14065, partial [Thermomicrobiales bacterium]